MPTTTHARVAAIAAVALMATAAPAHAARIVSPLNPITTPPPVRAGFLDTRPGWHSGADVVVNETKCSSRAPARGCRRVYAMTTGRAWWTARGPGGCGLVRVGSYGYGHVRVTVRRGQRVTAGQQIGWSCRGVWHVHVGEFRSHPCYTPGQGDPSWPACGRYDPLRAGDVFADPTDHTGPVVKSWAIVDGYLDARIEDARDPGFLIGSLARLYNDLAPSRVDVNGHTLIDASVWPMMAPPSRVYAPEAYRNIPAPVCGASPGRASCAGQYVFRLGTFAPGDVVTVDAWDPAGNRSTTPITIPGGTP